METILIVDDEKNYLVVLEALLGAEGYEIVTANDAKSALATLREADLDLVITDMKMPGMSGMALLEECKNIKPELPVIMMTAFGTIEMAVEAGGGRRRRAAPARRRGNDLEAAVDPKGRTGLHRAHGLSAAGQALHRRAALPEFVR